ncbi:MAG: glycosyltransferase [Methanosarcinaceae archaeon]|nr:glycosyltransferase [Methanosarcinaceae archaeon]
MLLILTLIVTAIPLSVYLIYILAAINSKSNSLKPLQQLPQISIVIPAYNEESVIGDRIKNIVEVYPVDLIELVITNDASTDNTANMASQVMKDLGIKGKILTNEKRSGVNFTVNHGVSKASNEIIVLTGADGEFDKDTIPNLLAVLLSSDDVGAVSGDLIPVYQKKAVSTRSEDAYRSIYGKICVWESNVHSTYCFNGPATALKKTARANVHVTKGADDASTALGIIKNGYRCLYVPDAKFYEYIPDKLKEHKRQKIRRATRLLEATLVHKDLLSSKYGRFGTIVYPLRILMFFVCPFMVFASIVLWTYLLSQINILYGIAAITSVVLLLLFGNIKSNMISSFLLYQGYLLIGLINMFRDVHLWEPTERVNI